MVRTDRRGLTVIELLVVMVIIGVIATIAYPRGARAAARSELRSAAQEVQSTIVLARAAAIQNGRPARFVRTGDVVQALLERGTQLVPLAGPVDVAPSQVRIETTGDTIRFDPRGFASGLQGGSSYQLVRLYRGTSADTICVSRFGRISSGGTCQ